MKTSLGRGAAVMVALAFLGCGADDVAGGAGGAGGAGATSTSDASGVTTSAPSSSAASSSGGGQGGAGGGGEGGQGGEGGAATVDVCEGWALANSPGGCVPDVVAPLAGEETHWIAARLTPPSYPFTVTAVRYALAQGDVGSVTCNNGLAHAVEVFVGTDVAPVASPSIIEHADVDASAAVDGIRTFDHTLTRPLTLETGEYLFVAVQNAGVSPADCTCFATCKTGYVPDTNYWSNAGAPPYPWATLESFGASLQVNYSVCAEGMP